VKAVHAINAYSGAVSSVKAKRKPVRKCDLAAEQTQQGHCILHPARDQRG